MTAGVTDRALDECAAAALRFNAAQDALKKVEIEAELANYFTDKLIRSVVFVLLCRGVWGGCDVITDVSVVCVAVRLFLSCGNSANGC